jgi:moderate conductance mechanosensitive channel
VLDVLANLWATPWVRDTARLAADLSFYVAAAVVTGRATAWVASRRLARSPDASPDRRARVSVAVWTLRAGYCIWAGVLVVDRVDLPVASLVPVATILGFALGWGAQRVVLDLLAGLFLILERQFGVGDLIRVSSPGSRDGLEGRVELITPRIIKIRTFEGDLVSIAAGELRQVANLSRDWARIVVDVPVTLDEEWDLLADRIEEICRTLADEPAYREALLESPTVAGVEEIGSSTATIRVVGRAVPGKQRVVARELRRRIAGSLAVDARVSTSPPTTGEIPVTRATNGQGV